MANRLLIDIIANDKTKAGLNLVQKRLRSVRQSVFSLKGALVGLGAGAVVKSFVDVGREIESLQIRFKFLFGSAEEGAKAFDNLSKFAGRVPFSLEQITRASGNLAVVSDDANDLNRILEITGNVAAVTGLDFETTASQIQRAFSGGIAAADIFREKGVRDLLGFKEGAKVSIDETVAAFEAAFSGNGRFAKATEDLAQSLEGTISMIGDKYFNFQKDVAQGFFDELKKEFGDLNDFLEANEDQIKDIADAIGKNFAGAITTTSDLIKGVAPAVKDISDALGTTIDGFKSLPTFVQTSGIIAALLFGKTGFVAFGAVSFLLGQIQEILKEAESIGATANLDFGNVSNVEQLNQQLDGFKRRRQEIINDISKVLRGEDTELSLDVLNKSLTETDNQIKNITDRITLLKTLPENLELASKQGEAFANGISNVKEKLVEVNEIQNEINNQLERENLLILSNTDALREFKEKYDPITAAIEEAQNEQIALNKLVNDGVITADQAARARIQIENELAEELKAIYEQTENERIEMIRKEGSVLDNLKQNYDEFFESFNANLEIANALTDAFGDLKRGIGDAVAQSIVFGKTFQETFGNVARQALASLISALVQVGVQLLANQVIQMLGMESAEKNTTQSMKKIQADALPAAFLVSLATGGRNAIGAIAGTVATFAVTQLLGSRQNGGPVFAGQPVMVGETGKEMFVPSQNGEIIPNREIGKGTVVNITINANDTQGFDDLLIRRRSVIVNVINDALNSQGKEALI